MYARIIKMAHRLDVTGHSDLADRLVMAMPYYRQEQNEDRAREIIERGYEPSPDAIYTYIDEYSDRFVDDLSPEAQEELEAYVEAHPELQEELRTYGRGGKHWEGYVDKLANLWFEENPRTVLLWLASAPPGPDTFGDALLRFSPPEDVAVDSFLNDHTYGWASKIVPPDGATAIPGDWFSLVPNEEYEQYEDDWEHWTQ